MSYFIFLALIFLLSLFPARVISAFHPDLTFNKYVLVRSRKLQLLFISQTSPIDLRSRSKKEHRNKMTVPGIVFYCLWLFTVIFSVLLIIFGPRTVIAEPIKISNVSVSLLNEAVALMSALSFFSLECAFCLFNVLPSLKDNKVIRALLCVIIAFIFLLSVLALVETETLFF